MLHWCWIIFSLGCLLERVTGEEIPLDPRFYAAVEESRGSADQGGGSSVPFSSVKSEKVWVNGTVTSEDDMAIDIDIRVPDLNAPGGMAGKGKLLLERPGEFTLAVPKNLGSLELQAFQDIDSDGPNAEDPFAQLTITIGTENLESVELALVVGARGAAPVHQEVNPEQSGEMPKGVPVATVALNGATNAGILAAQILGIQDVELRQRIKNHKNDMKKAVKNMADSL